MGLAKLKHLLWANLELIFWVAGLSCLAFTNPTAQAHFSLCPLKALGFKWCPGCGLGHSISFLFRGMIAQSVKAHWLGIPALVLILNRIAKLFWNNFVTFK